MKKVTIDYYYILRRNAILDIDENESNAINSKLIHDYVNNIEEPTGIIEIISLYANNYNKQDLIKLSNLVIYQNEIKNKK